MKVEHKVQLRPRDAILRMEPYRPPSSGRGGKMRLDFNENTVGCSKRVLKRLKGLRREELATYPEYEDALPKMARHFGVKRDQLTLTNGTDEAIQLVVNTFVNPGDRVVVLRPSYAMYRFYAEVMGADVEEVEYAGDLSFPQSELLARLGAGVRGVFIANPNNPTGTVAEPAQLRALLQAAPQTAILIDEAYYEFSGQTVLSWIKRYPNLFVSRTFSKVYGLAALRVGCLFSQEQNIAAVRKGQSPYSVNSAGVAAALAALEDSRSVRKYAAEVERSRQMLVLELDRLGWRHFPSAANFLLVKFGAAAQRVQERLAKQKILVRDRSYEIDGCVRITLGTTAQTQKLIRALRRASKGFTTDGTKAKRA
jgi:histidinol-phosphate aminotransferase